MFIPNPKQIVLVISYLYYITKMLLIPIYAKVRIPFLIVNSRIRDIELKQFMQYS